MKRRKIKAAALAVGTGLLCLCALIVSSCDILGTGSVGEGELRIAFSESTPFVSKAAASLPDTSDFILTVSNASGEVLYEGKFGDSPESIMVKEGSYTVSAVSEKFDKPAFAKPQYGDQQCVIVPSSGVVNVKLICRQMNCGVKLNVDPGFLTACQDGVLFLKSDEGKLMYGYSEKRIAYFNPGTVSLLLNRAGRDEVLTSRNLEAQQVLVLGVNVSQTTGSAKKETISVSVDTSRVWISDDYTIGGSGGKGSESSDALTVSQAMSSVGEEEVWVSGYVVGGDLTSACASFEAPFSSRTCLLLGPRSSTEDRSSCISVQLPAGDVRDALNLVDNPEILGKKVLVRGDVVPSYYGLVGLKNCTAYKL